MTEKRKVYVLVLALDSDDGAWPEIAGAFETLEAAQACVPGGEWEPLTYQGLPHRVPIWWCEIERVWHQLESGGERGEGGHNWEIHEYELGVYVKPAHL